MDYHGRETGQTVTVHCATLQALISAFLLALTWLNTRSENAEPERCDDLHWDLWGIGGHGNGLLCLLVSFDKMFLVKLLRLLANVVGLTHRDKQGMFVFSIENARCDYLNVFCFQSK